MKRQIQANAVAAMFDAVTKLDTSQVLAPDLLPRNSGRSGGCTTVLGVVNMGGQELRLVDP